MDHRLHLQELPGVFVMRQIRLTKGLHQVHSGKVEMFAAILHREEINRSVIKVFICTLSRFQDFLYSIALYTSDCVGETQ